MPFTRRRLITSAAQAYAAAAVLPRAVGAQTIKVDPWPALHLPDGALRDEDYFAVSDEVVQRLNRTWDESELVYSGGGRVINVIYNAAMLVIHAAAAGRGYSGPSRNDERARVLTARLCESPPFFAGRTLPHPDSMFHTPGWLGDLDTFDSPMDKAIDPKVAEALTAAWRARDVLGLDPAVVERLRGCVDAVARGPFFRYPSVRLNQINWNAELYACAAALTGNPELLRVDYRRHLARWCRGVRRPLHRDWARNLSDSYRFQYQTTWKGSRKNVDSAEYANITLHFLIWYETALRAGMAPLGSEDVALLRAWMARVQFGYWMHNGMLSWDSGLGFKRWMKAKTWAYALQGPLTIAVTPRFWLRPEQGAWAKYVFDQGLRQFAIRCADLAPRHLPSPHLYDVGAAYQGTGSRRLYVARMGANAARAVVHGLGGLDSASPPPFYSFDADVGRLNVSTRRYGCAVIARGGGALPYGGIELARLFDSSGVPVGGVGGRPPASFGVVVRKRAGRGRVLASQGRPKGARVRLARSPHGEVSQVRRLPRSPDAGPFGALEAVGTVAGRGASITCRHRFKPDYIESTWRVALERPGLFAELLFPSWGGKEATITAVSADGSVVDLPPGATIDATTVRFFHLAGPRSGYALVIPGATGVARAAKVARQPAAPRPGPTLIFHLPAGVDLRARLAPATTLDHAREVAAQLTRGA
jgi:hypothetical protein